MLLVLQGQYHFELALRPAVANTVGRAVADTAVVHISIEPTAVDIAVVQAVKPAADTAVVQSAVLAVEPPAHTGVEQAVTPAADTAVVEAAEPAAHTAIVQSAVEAVNQQQT